MVDKTPSTVVSEWVRPVMLTVLVVQTSTLVLLLRYSRRSEEDELYFASTVVFFTELLKYFLCVAVLTYQTGSLAAMVTVYKREVVGKPMETSILAIPALLYVVQNNLLIQAITYLDAATYQVTYQLKILTTAGFSVMLLGRVISIRQWVALLLLMLGISLVQLPLMGGETTSSNSYSEAVTGFIFVVIASFSSGFAGVFYERLVKQSEQNSVIIRNLQLGLFSLMFAFIAMVTYSWREILKFGLFHGYSRSVICVITLQAFGGLVVAGTIKYADSILKGFATSISIIVSSLSSWLLLEDLFPGSYFLAGSLLVIVASFMYGVPSFHSCATSSRRHLLHV